MVASSTRVDHGIRLDAGDEVAERMVEALIELSARCNSVGLSRFAPSRYIPDGEVRADNAVRQA